MALTERQEDLYQDRSWIYRVTGYDAEGDPLGYAAVEGEQDVPCKLFSTDQYDQPNSPAGLSNRDGLMTADYLHEESGRGTRADDVKLVVQAGSAETLWYSVKGAPKNRPSQGERATNYQKVYMTITPIPRLVTAASLTAPWDLGTSWEADFAVSPASPTFVQSVTELRQAAGAGGYVVLRPGVYDLSGEALSLAPGTVVRGWTRSSAILRVGGQYGPGSDPGDDAQLYRAWSDCGLMDLTIVNASASESPVRLLAVAYGAERIAVRNLGVQAARGRLGIGAADYLVEDLDFVGTDLAPAFGGSRGEIRSVRADYRTGRVDVTFSDSLSLSDCTFRRVGPRLPEEESGGIEASFARGLSLVGVSVEHLGGDLSGNSLEGFNTQKATVFDFGGLGTVASRVGNRVATTIRRSGTPLLSPAHPVTRRMALFILSGSAAKSWAWLQESSDGTYDLFDPDGQPKTLSVSPGDAVAVSAVNAFRQTVSACSFRGWKVGAQLYQGGLECRFEDCVLEDAGELLLRAFADPAHGQTLPLWDCEAVGTLVSDDRESPYRARVRILASSDGPGVPLMVARCALSGSRVSARPRGGSPALDGVRVEALQEGSALLDTSAMVDGATLVSGSDLSGGAALFDCRTAYPALVP